MIVFSLVLLEESTQSFKQTPVFEPPPPDQVSQTLLQDDTWASVYFEGPQVLRMCSEGWEELR